MHLTAAHRVPVEIVKYICARVYELHGIDMVERAATFRIFYEATWAIIMEDIRHNTPRYTLELPQPPYGVTRMHLYLPNCDLLQLGIGGRPMFSANVLATAHRRAHSMG
jgi:hypothetical protein